MAPLAFGSHRVPAPMTWAFLAPATLELFVVGFHVLDAAPDAGRERLTDACAAPEAAA